MLLDFLSLFSVEYIIQFVVCRTAPCMCLLKKICIHPPTVKVMEQWTFLSILS